jgi:hypothetical protein
MECAATIWRAGWLAGTPVSAEFSHGDSYYYLAGRLIAQGSSKQTIVAVADCKKWLRQ